MVLPDLRLRCRGLKLRKSAGTDGTKGMAVEKKIKAAFFSDGDGGAGDEHVINRVYSSEQREKLAGITDLYPEIITSDNFEEHLGNLQHLGVVFSTWGMVPMTREQVGRLPHLKALFYAAGATAPFRGPFEENGVIVCSASSANAIPVAEFALAQILLAGAGYFRSTPNTADTWHAQRRNSFANYGNYRQRIAILGDGAVSGRLQQLLKPHDLDVTVVSSYAERRTVSLEEGFSSSNIVINLFPCLGDNDGILNAALFERMPGNAVFINVGRGRQVNEPDLIRVMKARPDLTALLDVQCEEPPEDGSGLYTLPNIRLSAHIAGSKGRELGRLADYMIEDFLRFESGEPLLYQVQPDQL